MGRVVIAASLAIVVIWHAGLASAGPPSIALESLDSILMQACSPSYPDFCIPPPPPDLNCNSPIIAGRHNFRALPPDPHNLDTDNDGIACESATPDTPTPTPTSPPGPVPTATFTPVVPVSCVPRPRVVVAATRAGPGQLQATLSASSNPTGPANTIQALTFGTIRNASVQVIGIGAATSGQRIALPGGTLSVALLATGQNTFVPLTVTDGCGDWRTFVGLGPGG